MCEPTSATLLIASTAIGAAGTIYSGIAQKQAADTRAKLAERQADDALERGRQEEERSRERTSDLIGRQRAGFAASGVATDTGTPLSVQANTSGLGERDALIIRQNAEREATSLRNQASVSRSEGDNALTGSILTTGATVSGGLYDYYRDF